jgi:hypothetical protein
VVGAHGVNVAVPTPFLALADLLSTPMRWLDEMSDADAAAWEPFLDDDLPWDRWPEPER